MLDFKVLKEKRKLFCMTKDEYQLIKYIRKVVNGLNTDNISRTHAYLDFYKKYPEMEWALLASMVSRNAGWNMTDLKAEPIFQLFGERYLMVLFHTYERPNWLIFHDAFPQLLLYAASIEWGRPLFHLLKAFDVSLFMEAEWENYWQTKDSVRLSYALITNEQNVIQQPVIHHQYYADRVFEHIVFKIEECLRLNAVVFPDMHGSLYGFPVVYFNDVDARILLGKKLHTLLFQAPEAIEIRKFALNTQHTGARFDYEIFNQPHMSANKKNLRDLFKVVTHRRLVDKDWFNGVIEDQWFDMPEIGAYNLSKWYRKKRKHLSTIGKLVIPLKTMKNKTPE